MLCVYNQWQLWYIFKCNVFSIIWIIVRRIFNANEDWFLQASLLISLPEFRSFDKNDFTMILKKYEVLVFYGDAFYVDEEFKRAEVNLLFAYH